MNNYFFVLEHLSYIIECLSIDITGEAKTEILNLKEKILNDDNFKIDGSDVIISKLDQALNPPSDSSNWDRYRAGSILSSISRNLWKNIMVEINSTIK